MPRWLGLTREQRIESYHSGIGQIPVGVAFHWWILPSLDGDAIQIPALYFRRKRTGSDTTDSKAIQISNGLQYFSAGIPPSTSGQNGSVQEYACNTTIPSDCYQACGVLLLHMLFIALFSTILSSLHALVMNLFL